MSPADSQDSEFPTPGSSVRPGASKPAPELDRAASEAQDRNFRSTLGLIRMAVLILAVSQPLYLIWQRYSNAPHIAFLTIYHALNFAAAVIVLGLSCASRFRRWWQAVTFGLCVEVLAAATMVSILTGGRPEAMFQTLVLLFFGTALLVPWDPKWQVGVGVAGLAAMTLNATLAWARDPLITDHWVSLLVAAALAQGAAWHAQRSRARKLEVDRLTVSGGRLRAEIAERERVERQLRQTVADLQNTERELTTARGAAMAALQAKSEFLSTISHEIRTPMNVILGMVEIIQETPLNTEQRHYLETMHANGQVLLELINSVLDVARIESGRLQLEHAEFNLVDLAEQAGATFGLRAHEKGLELVVHVAPDVPRRLKGDPLRLRQILLNLVGNAVKFTEQGEIVLKVENESSADTPAELRAGGRCRLHFSVADSGVGIPPGKLATVFSVFTQADSSTTRKYGGSGLGLTIVKRLVELMEGEVWAQSEPSRGSVFHVRLEFEVAPPEAAQEPALPLAGRRVLLADLLPVSRQVLREMLEAAGAAVDEAASVSEASACIQRQAEAGQPYHCLLLDARMPEADAALATLGAAGSPAGTDRPPPLKAIPMLSSYDLGVKTARLGYAGFSVFVVKPLKRADVLKAVTTLLELEAPASQPQQKPEPASRPEVTPAPEKIRLHILLAEDSPDNQMLIRLYLKDAPFRLDFADNGAAAVEKFRRGRYDLVLMDHQMPVMDGYAATKAIRAWETEQGRAPTPIIALTASTFDDDVRESLAAGCTAHISKPVRKAVLLQALNSIAPAQFASGAPAEPSMS